MGHDQPCVTDVDVSMTYRDIHAYDTNILIILIFAITQALPYFSCKSVLLSTNYNFANTLNFPYPVYSNIDAFITCRDILVYHQWSRC